MAFNLILIVFDPSKAKSASVAKNLDTHMSLENWFTIFPNAIVVETAETAQSISSQLQTLHPGMSLICVKFNPSEASGLLPQAITKEIAARRT